MKTKLKNLFIAALLVAPVIFCACSGNKTAGASDSSDTINYRDYIRKLSYEDTEKALAFIDSLEMLKKYPAYLLNFYRCAVYNSSKDTPTRYILHYGYLAISDPSFKKENRELYMNALYALSFSEYLSNHISKSLKLLKELMDIAIEDKDESMQILCLEIMANDKMQLGDFDNAIKDYKEALERSVIFFNENPTFKSFETTINQHLGLLRVLNYMNEHSEEEKYIPGLLAILEKGKNIKFPSDTFYDTTKWSVYVTLMDLYDFMGKTDEVEKYRILSETTQAAKLPRNRITYFGYYINNGNYKQAWTDLDIARKYYVEKRDTVTEFYFSDILWNELQYYKATENFEKACNAAEKIIVCKDSIRLRMEIEDAAQLAKIYETQEKEKQLAEQKAELTKQRNIIISVATLLVIGAVFIVVLMRLNRKVKRRNKTIVATINNMMQKEDELTLLQLTDDSNKAENINPEELRLKQSLDMLKEDKSIEDIVKEGAYKNADDFNKKFYDYFGIHAEEYRKWSKNMNKQEQTGIEEAKHMKESFIRNMSHEIRTPLNQIYGFVQLLTTPGIQLSDEEKQKFTGIIDEQTTHMTQMLNTFLEMSQYESSSERLPMETVDIDELLSQSCDYFPSVKEGVVLTHKNNSGLKTMECNSKGILRILHCIIDNAIKFTDEGQVCVECSKNEDGDIVFSVTDTGKGVPEGDDERIFEQFYKVDEFIPGTGLGLSLARQIANRMGASIVLDRSYEAKGSRFVISYEKIK